MTNVFLWARADSDVQMNSLHCLDATWLWKLGCLARGTDEVSNGLSPSKGDKSGGRSVGELRWLILRRCKEVSILLTRFGRERVLVFKLLKISRSIKLIARHSVARYELVDLLFFNSWSKKITFSLAIVCGFNPWVMFRSSLMYPPVFLLSIKTFLTWWQWQPSSDTVVH